MKKSDTNKRFIRYLWLLTIPVLTSCISPRGKVLETLHAIDSEQLLLAQSASSLRAFRKTIESSVEVTELVKQGAISAQISADRLSAHCRNFSDTSAAIYAFVLEKNTHPDAISVLENYLLNDFEECGHTFGFNFAVRTLLVLKKLPDSGEGYNEYSPDSVKRALAAP